jgi:ArsR family transcriptional regulator
MDLELRSNRHDNTEARPLNGNDLECEGKSGQERELSRLRSLVQQNARTIRRASDHYSLLAGETRLNIMMLLDNAGELCVCDLASVLEMTPAAVSQHLSRLKGGQLVDSRRDGMTIYYRLAEPLAPAILTVETRRR